MRSVPVSPALAQFVLERSGYACDRCGVSIIGRPFSRQHRRAKGAGGRRDGYLNTPENLILLCGSATSPGCHGLVENSPVPGARTEAYRLGFAIKGEAQDPAAVPVFRHLREWQLPTADGWVPAEPLGELDTAA